MLLKNCTFIDFQTLEIKENVNILVEKGENGGIKFVDENTIDEKIIDCKNKIVTKSFVHGHHHAYSALALGMPQPPKKPLNFLEILQKIWWNLDKKLNAKQIEACGLVTAMQCAKNGVTLVIDHHSSPNSITGSLEILAESFERIGVSHLLCYEISDRDGKEKSKQALEETDYYLSKKQGLVGLHASFTVDNDTLEKAAQLVEKHNSGIHIHVAEDPIDEFLTYEKYGSTVIERLYKYNFLNNSKSILSHCLHLNERERHILSKSNCFIVQNVESNLNNEVGTFDYEDLNHSKIMIGTDGMHSDMIRATQSTFFVNKNHNELNLQNVYNHLRNNNKYIKINNFKGDSDNNLIIFDYNPPTPFLQENILGHFFYGISSSDIIHVISNGELILENKKLTKINEQEILIFARQQAKELWKKI